MTSIFCADCLLSLAEEEVPGVSKTTLIVCPDAILRQWTDEVERHVTDGSLKVCIGLTHVASAAPKSTGCSVEQSQSAF
jgi:SNF2 family DNA or RNA helicase